MRKLRLLLFSNCTRQCSFCCNNDWDLSILPICHDYSIFDIVMLTGGEPMLKPELVTDTIYNIRKTSKALIYIYTAKTDELETVVDILELADGITVTLHEQKDVDDWENFSISIGQDLRNRKSLRLNVFRGIRFDYRYAAGWSVKENIDWIRNCPLPKDEVLMRLNHRL